MPGKNQWELGIHLSYALENSLFEYLLEWDTYKKYGPYKVNAHSHSPQKDPNNNQSTKQKLLLKKAVNNNKKRKKALEELSQHMYESSWFFYVKILHWFHK